MSSSGLTEQERREMMERAVAMRSEWLGGPLVLMVDFALSEIARRGLTEKERAVVRIAEKWRKWHAAPDSAFMSGHLVELVAAVDALEAERTPRERYTPSLHGEADALTCYSGVADNGSPMTVGEVIRALNQAARDGNGGDR